MHDDAATLTPDQRRAELAAILALGVLRLHRRQHLDPPSLLEIDPESAQIGLDVPREQSVHGDRRVNTGENHREERE
ncbi:MAG: hypothetical protein H7Z14_07360 [Anaerolineae bacterium]|nr:hypothetical protein [Phycisphaerae bacterium]